MKRKPPIKQVAKLIYEAHERHAKKYNYHTFDKPFNEAPEKLRLCLRDMAKDLRDALCKTS